MIKRICDLSRLSRAAKTGRESSGMRKEPLLAKAVLCVRHRVRPWFQYSALSKSIKGLLPWNSLRWQACKEREVCWVCG